MERENLYVYTELPTADVSYVGYLTLIGGTIDQLDQAREGWLAIDWIENPVGFVPDGYEQQGEEHVFIIQPGPYKHLCAYQIDWYGEELIQQHQKMIASK
jgi:hypothetical protein